MLEFEYVVASSLENALLLFNNDDKLAEMRVLAGGTRLLVDLRAGILKPARIVDLHTIADLKYIRSTGRDITIGAMTTLAEVERSSLLWSEAPLMTDMARMFAHPVVRESATLGGNIATLAPAMDAVVPLLALDATVVLHSKALGERQLPLTTFLVEQVQRPDQRQALITQVRFPIPSKGAFQFYRRFGNRKAGSTPIVSVALLLDVSHGHIQQARIALGSIASVPFRATAAEAILLQQPLPLRSSVIDHALSLLDSHIQEFNDDRTVSIAYRKEMGKALVRNALQSVNASS
jgi:CO/xanthine dehydrogenase FAD-binding subunit